VARAAAAGVELPICQAVADLLGARATVAEAMARLLARPRRDE
jgi:glycerol-3-phosphate dehydrogenase (NAD(P)+)